MYDSNQFNAKKYINERAHWSIALLLAGLEGRGLSRADAQQLLREFVDEQCSR